MQPDVYSILDTSFRKFSLPLPIIESLAGSSRCGQTSRPAKWYEHLEPRPWVTELTALWWSLPLWHSVMPLFDESSCRNQQQGRSVGSAIARCSDVFELYVLVLSDPLCVCHHYPQCVCVLNSWSYVRFDMFCLAVLVSLLCTWNVNNSTCKQSAIL